MTATLAAEPLPRWDMSNIYTGLEGADYQAAVARLEAELTGFEELLDAHGIRRLPAASHAEAAALAATLAAALRRANDVARLSETLDAFVYAFLTTDSYNAAATREYSRLELLDTRRKRLDVRLRGWIGSLEARLPELIAADAYLHEHAFYLRHSAQQSRYLMPEDQESLAAELCVDGGNAFGKLQGTVTSQLKVPFDRDGVVEQLPIAVVRNLSYDSDREVRRRAYDAELDGWHSIRSTVAACLNGVKGTALTLARRRRRASVLDAALDDNRIDRATLDALLGAIREALPTFRRYLRAKADKLDLERLAWWDVHAPMGAAERTLAWTEARDFLVDKFGGFSPDLGRFAARAFDENWIDAGPRDGKRGGAFCMGVIGVEQSRVLMNYDGSFEQVSTLAHELGHAWHNYCQTGLPPLRRGSPSTLAETASIFCETLIAEASLSHADRDEQLMILETQLANATGVCLDISSRFLFESAFLERRQKSELGSEEICELMLAAQRETYADSVDEATYHRYMWLWKPHYYSPAENFYNFPYAFGHLFGLGLYAAYRREGERFVPRYRELLRATAQEQAAPLAARFGIDITQPDFWRSSLAIVAEQVRRYEEL